MSDFCKQCSIEMFGEDYKDLAGLSTEEDTSNGLYASAICEGCGTVVQVDHEGTCVSPYCTKHGGAGLMKSYHLTQEQAWEVAENLDYTNSSESGLKGTVLMSKSELLTFANAVLDQVLGEPVAEFIEASDEESFGSVAWLLCNGEPLKTGDKLYAPKEQS